MGSEIEGMVELLKTGKYYREVAAIWFVGKHCAVKLFLEVIP